MQTRGQLPAAYEPQRKRPTPVNRQAMRANLKALQRKIQARQPGRTGR